MPYVVLFQSDGPLPHPFEDPGIDPGINLNGEPHVDRDFV